jgi:aspartate 1-decarboxylase
MIITVLKAKIHRVPVTHTEIDYEGSCAIDTNYLEKTGIKPNEQIHIYNLNNGERLITYAFEAKRGSKIISMNGAAALKASIGDLVIIAAYGQIKDEESSKHTPKVLTIK